MFSRSPSAISCKISRSPSSTSKLSRFFSRCTNSLTVNTSPLSIKIAEGTIIDEGHGIFKKIMPKISRRARASKKAREKLAMVTDPNYQAELKAKELLEYPLTFVDPVPLSSCDKDDKEDSGVDAETMVDTMADEEVEADAGADATTTVETNVIADDGSEADTEVEMDFEVEFKPTVKAEAPKKKVMPDVKGMFSKFVPAMKQLFVKNKKANTPAKPKAPPMLPQRVPSASREPFIKPEYSQLEAVHTGFERLILEMPVYAKPREGFRANTCPGFTKDLKEMYACMYEYTSNLDQVAKGAHDKCQKISDATYDAYLFRDKVFEFFDNIKYQEALMGYAQQLVLYYKNNGYTNEEILKLADDYAEWKSTFLDYESLMNQYPALFKEANKDIKEANQYSESLMKHLGVAKRMEETFSKLKRKFGYRRSLKRRYLDRLSEFFDELKEAFEGSVSYELLQEFTEYVSRANADLFESLEKLKHILNVIIVIHDSNSLTDRYIYDLLRERDLC